MIGDRLRDTQETSMPRRQTQNTTGIRGTGVVDASAVWRVFECSRPSCDQLIKVSEDWIEEQHTSGVSVTVECPKCAFQNTE